MDIDTARSPRMIQIQGRRSNEQRYPRLRHRPRTAQPGGTVPGRLRRQPTSIARPNQPSRLGRGRRRPATPSAWGAGVRTACVGLTLRRYPRPILDAGHAVVCPPHPRLLQPRSAHATLRLAGPELKSTAPRSDDLRFAPSAPARLHRALPPGSRRYCVTETGMRIAMFYTPVYNCLRQPGPSLVSPGSIPIYSAFNSYFVAINDAINSLCDNAKVAA